MTRAELLPLRTALERLMAAAPPPPATERVALADALHRVLAGAHCAAIDVPPGDNSAMDGYALRAGDAGCQLPVVQRIAAGDTPQILPPGTAARIFTGALVPVGADAVVLQEDCERSGDMVRVPGEIDVGQHIRRRGQDMRAGETLLSAGRELRPQDLGLLASQGLAAIDVYRPLRVALLSTGSELKEAGTGPLAEGQIYNSNRPMLKALLQGLGCEVVDHGIVADSALATAEALTAAAQADVIVSSGGVSVGEADYVRDQVAAQGAIDVWRIAIKPGKPFAFGRVGTTPFIGLPGNPSSAFVTFVLLARPFIHLAQGRAAQPVNTLPARAEFAVEQPGVRQEFLRATVSLRDGELWAASYANQSSGVLSSLSASNALAVVPVGETVARGDRVDIMLLDELLR